MSGVMEYYKNWVPQALNCATDDSDKGFEKTNPDQTLIGVFIKNTEVAAGYGVTITLTKSNVSFDLASGDSIDFPLVEVAFSYKNQTATEDASILVIERYL